ncbi:MAG TPA: glycosyltransferase family 2 protein, partial [Verrucomicrobiae bacterium]|nr:glycosyltransferase family 2 protein [Verrucomicrobiae bacterium]
ADDGSSDGSLEIIRQFAARDPRIRWWKNPRNFGLTANANVCLKAARGEYVKFVHQDDKLLSPSAIRKMAAALDENPRASLVGSRQHLTGTNKRPTVFFSQSGCFQGRRMIVTCLEQNNNLIGQPTLTLFRRSAAQRGFDERFTGHMDFEMWCHLLEQGDFVYLDEPLATWRVHEHHQTARSRSRGVKDYEHLRFMEIYWAKPWLREMATDRMLFAQIYYLRKHYGREAWPLTSAMLSRLSRRRYVWQWLKHKVSRPFQKLSGKFRRQ